MKTKSINQTVTIKASPEDVFEALMDSAHHSKFTGGEAKISRKVNGKFTTFDGYAEGRNKKLEKGKIIVQEWRAEEDGWPKDHFSTITFKLDPVKDGTKLTFTQDGVPEKNAKSIADGWKQYYWEPMKEMLEK